MSSIRQSKQLQADRQAADPETKSSSSDRQADQTGAETDHNNGLANTWYEASDSCWLASTLLSIRKQMVVKTLLS